MSQEDTVPTPAKPAFRPESQHERWLKYGVNVVVVSVVVIVLAVVVIWLAQMWDHRVDTTTAGLYSLKPQTVNIIKENKQPIKLVSLLTKTKTQRASTDEPEIDMVQPVIDLLEEYHDKGKHIEYEVIDPAAQPAKVDQLIDDVMNKYGGEVRKYRDWIAVFMPSEKGAKAPEKPTTRPSATYAELKKQVEELSAETTKLSGTQMKVTQEMYITLNLAFQTVKRFPQYMDSVKDDTERMLKQSPPDLKGAVDAINNGLTKLSESLDPVIENFQAAQKDDKIDPVLKEFITKTLPGFKQLKAEADEDTRRIKGLGELKLDEVRRSLKAGDAVLVLGETEMRSVPREKIWQVPEDVRGFTAEGKPKPRFHGEQQITSAILSLSSKAKTKVCFVRPGGPPLTSQGIPGFQEGGPFSEIAQRLRDYNFEVQEKDLSGMYAMQAQMRQQFAPPEPSDEEIKDAVWVVLDLPNPPQQQGGPPPSIAPKVAEHMKNGGAALILARPRSDPLAAVLDEWGVKIDPDHVIVHEPVTGATNASDFIEQAQKQPIIFFIKQFGDHPLTRPVNGLEGVILPMIPVTAQAKAGYKAASLIPVPQTLKIWGESDISAAMSGGNIQYDAPKPPEKGGDLPPPFNAGAAVEKDGGGRLVVFGSVEFAMDNILTIPDPGLLQQRIYAARFPANGELFMNSIFWLSKQDAMIAISPAAMDAARVGDISKGTLNFWRVGVLLIGLPLLVVIAGALMYVNRRD
jgi:hypothetical protein